jgi:hypothetical protein
MQRTKTKSESNPSLYPCSLAWSTFSSFLNVSSHPSAAAREILALISS